MVVVSPAKTTSNRAGVAGGAVAAKVSAAAAAGGRDSVTGDSSAGVSRSGVRGHPVVAPGRSRGSPQRAAHGGLGGESKIWQQNADGYAKIHDLEPDPKTECDQRELEERRPFVSTLQGDLARPLENSASCAIIDGGSKALLGGKDGELRMWDLANNVVIKMLGLGEKEITHCELVPDRSEVVTLTNDGVRLWSVDGLHLRGKGETHFPACEIPSDGKQRFLFCTPIPGHGKCLTAVRPVREGDDWSKLILVDITSKGTRQYAEAVRAEAGHKSSTDVNDCKVFRDAYSGDLRAVSCGNDGAMIIWDLQQWLADVDGAPAPEPEPEDDQQAAQAGRSSKYILYRLVHSKASDKAHDNHVISCEVFGHHRGQRVLSWSKDHTLRVWDLNVQPEEESAEACLIALGEETEGHRDTVRHCVLFAEGGGAYRQALSCSDDGTLRVWDLVSLDCSRFDGKAIIMRSPRKDPVCSCAVLRDGCRAVSASERGTLQVWDLATGLSLHVLREGTGARPRCIMLPSGSVQFLSFSETDTHAWNLASQSWSAEVNTPQRTDLMSGFNVFDNGRRVLMWTTSKLFISNALPHTGEWRYDELNCMDQQRSEMVCCAAFCVERRTLVLVCTRDGAMLRVTLDDERTQDTVDWREVSKSTTGDRPISCELYESPEAVVAEDFPRRIHAIVCFEHGICRYDLASGEAHPVSSKSERALLGCSTFTCGTRRTISCLDGLGDPEKYELWDIHSTGTLRPLGECSCHEHEGTATPGHTVVVYAEGRKALCCTKQDSGKLAVIRMLGMEENDSGPDSPAVTVKVDGELTFQSLTQTTDTADTRGPQNIVYACCVFHEDERALSVSSDGTLRVWNLQEKEEMKYLRGFVPDLEDILWAPDRWSVGVTITKNLMVFIAYKKWGKIVAIDMSRADSDVASPLSLWHHRKFFDKSMQGKQADVYKSYTFTSQDWRKLAIETASRQPHILCAPLMHANDDEDGEHAEDGTAEFFVQLLAKMKIKPGKAREYAESLVAQGYDKELFNDKGDEALQRDFGFLKGDAKRVEKYRKGLDGPLVHKLANLRDGAQLLKDILDDHQRQVRQTQNKVANKAGGSLLARAGVGLVTERDDSQGPQSNEEAVQLLLDHQVELLRQSSMLTQSMASILMPEDAIVQLFSMYPAQAAALMQELPLLQVSLPPQWRRCRFATGGRNAPPMLETSDSITPKTCGGESSLWEERIYSLWRSHILGIDRSDEELTDDRRKLAAKLKAMEQAAKGAKALLQQKVYTTSRDMFDRDRSWGQPVRACIVPVGPCSEESKRRLPFSRLLEAVVQHSTSVQSLDVFNSAMVQAIIKQKWNSACREMHLTISYAYLLYIVSFSIVTIFFGVRSPGSGHFLEPVMTVLLGFTLVYTLLLLNREAHQLVRIHRSFRRYIADSWNKFDIVAEVLAVCALTLTGVCKARSGSPEASSESSGSVGAVSEAELCPIEMDTVHEIQAVAGLMGWLKAVYFLRGFDTTAPIVRMLGEILKDMVPFLVVLAFILVA
eukprot:COSAG04_NODE_1287_length_7366_cov_18.273153_3_plen_1522_part_00